jgi:serine/threonine protein kinase
VKLSDFGISKELDHTTAMSSSAVGSYRYMSPERLLGEKYDASADVWSIGVSIVELWNKKYPFEHVAETPIHLSGELQRFQLEKILPRSAGVSNAMRDFLKHTLAIDPNERYACMDLAQSLWFEACGITTLPESHQVMREKEKKYIFKNYFLTHFCFYINF